MDLDLDFGTDEEVGEATRTLQKRPSIIGGEQDKASTRNPKVANAQKTNKRKSEQLQEYEACTPSKKRGSKATRKDHTNWTPGRRQEQAHHCWHRPQRPRNAQLLVEAEQH